MRRRAFSWFAALAVGLAMSGGGALASIELWQGFYGPTKSRQGTAKVTDPQICVSEILKAQKKYGIPDNLLLAIGVQEAGRTGPNGLTVWPWSVNANGVGKYFTSFAKAVAWVRAKRNAGVRSIDVGCMQVNQKWHGEAFDDLEAAFTPAENVDYAARFLTGLYRSAGDWTKAAGMYHSRNTVFQRAYLRNLKVNQSFVNAHLPEIVAFIGAGPSGAQAASAKQPPLFWSADLSQQQQGGQPTYSIYSNLEIQMVLPAFSSEN